jgi:hypothetical protein
MAEDRTVTILLKVDLEGKTGRSRAGEPHSQSTESTGKRHLTVVRVLCINHVLI